MDILQPAWTDLEALVASATDELTIVTPFYTEDGVNRIFDRLGAATSLQVVTRLSPPDWAAGAADPQALFALLDLVRERCGLRIVRNLHAKVYVADRHTALLGSSNLTGGGFGGNVEMAVRVQGHEAEEVRAATLAACAAGKPLSVDALKRWIDLAEPKVAAAAKRETPIAEELADAQAELDRVLGFGRATKRLPDPAQDDLRDFVDWLRSRRTLPGADVVIRRHDNADGQNLQGHVKQSFFAAVRFCEDYPEVAAEMQGALGSLGPDDIYKPSTAVGEAWNRHLDDHALDTGAVWSYPVLRGELPASLGGSVANGGGGSSTLKRILPLVAEYRAATGAAAAQP